MKEIDAKGLACPRPVILTKKELDSEEVASVTTYVDNEVAKNNLIKLAQSMGYEYETKDIAENEFKVTIHKCRAEYPDVEGREVLDAKPLEDQLGFTIAISSDMMGKGKKALGKILMKSFVFTVSETEPLPKTMVFYNGGVLLTTDGSPVLEDLKRLEQAGVEIISCGTCLDFFGLKEKLRVGSISNMYSIYEKLRETARCLHIG